MTVPRKSKRRTSKALLAINSVLLWAATGYALWTTQSEAAMAFVGALVSIAGAYMGVGHLDFRMAAQYLSQPPEQPVEENTYAVANSELYVEDDDDSGFPVGFIDHRRKALPDGEGTGNPKGGAGEKGG